jgi:nucleoside phosphorylase
VNIGLGGSLDEDVLLGDVVAADVGDNYLERAKAVDTGDGYAIKCAGDPYRSDETLVDGCTHFEFSHSAEYVSWQRACRAAQAAIPSTYVDSLIQARQLRAVPALTVGHVATGPVVGSSDAFKTWLAGRDRSFLAMDMETAGVMLGAASFGGNTRVLALRTISDFADGRKKEVDRIGDGAIRRYALHNAFDLLRHMVAAGVLAEHH